MKFASIHRKIKTNSDAGYILVEGLIASVLLVIIITCFLVLISHGIKSLHMLHHRHELLLDARFSRIPHSL